MQASLFVVVLALEAEGLVDGAGGGWAGPQFGDAAGAGFSQGGGTPGAVVGGPDDVPVFIGQLLRRADLIALVPVGLAILHGCQRHEAVGFVQEQC